MSYIITDSKHYTNIANAIREKLQVNTTYLPEDMATAIASIPATSDGTDSPVGGIWFLNPDDNGNVTKIKYVNYNISSLSLEGLPTDKSYLKEVVFEQSSVTTIPVNCFQGCSNLSKINIPETVTTIAGAGSFQYCTSLMTLHLPHGLKTIGQWAFWGCSALNTINIPNTLNNIGADIFTLCSNLENVALENEFNCANLNLSVSTKYSKETIVSWINALADRSDTTAYRLQIGAKNLAKLEEEDIAIATAKNWTLA